VLTGRLPWFRQRESGLLGEQTDGVGEADPLLQFDELEDVASRVTPEAVEEPLFRST